MKLRHAIHIACHPVSNTDTRTTRIIHVFEVFKEEKKIIVADTDTTPYFK